MLRVTSPSPTPAMRAVGNSISSATSSPEPSRTSRCSDGVSVRSGTFQLPRSDPTDRRPNPNRPTGAARSPEYRKAVVAPDHMRDWFLAQVERTIQAKRKGKDARIVLKMNALVDARCIRALYEASQAGVKVDRLQCAVIPVGKVEESGKTFEDAQLAEVFFCSDALGFWGKSADKYLRDERVRTHSPAATALSRPSARATTCANTTSISTPSTACASLGSCTRSSWQ